MIEVAKIAKTALEGIAGINTVEIGIAKNISPKDYPIIRIVPVDSRPDQSISDYKRVNLTVFIGVSNLSDKDGMEAIYETLEQWEREVIERLNTAQGAAFFWKGTKQDEDRLQNVKVLALQFEALG